MTKKEERNIIMQHFVRGLVIAFIISVLLIPTLLFAQGDLTLEGLAEQITSLTERITKLEAIHTTVTVDGYCKLPVSVSYLDPEAESKWEALTGEETLTSFREGVEFNADQQKVSYYYQERYDGDYYGLFVYYDSDCNPTVGEWEILSD